MQVYYVQIEKLDNGKYAATVDTTEKYDDSDFLDSCSDETYEFDFDELPEWGIDIRSLIDNLPAGCSVFVERPNNQAKVRYWGLLEVSDAS